LKTSAKYTISIAQPTHISGAAMLHYFVFALKEHHGFTDFKVIVILGREIVAFLF